MKTYLKNHSEHLAILAVIIGLYVGAVCIGISWAVRLTH
jgi:hypothetical protein